MPFPNMYTSLTTKHLVKYFISMRGRAYDIDEVESDVTELRPKPSHHVGGIEREHTERVKMRIYEHSPMPRVLTDRVYTYVLI